MGRQFEIHLTFILLKYPGAVFRALLRSIRVPLFFEFSKSKHVKKQTKMKIKTTNAFCCE